MSSPIVHCQYHELVAATSLRPNPENPNKHSAKQIKAYGIVIELTGWRKAVVVSRQSGMIVKGHGAHATAMLKGWPVPVEFQDYATPELEFADLLADNHLAELASLDKKKVKELIEKRILSTSINPDVTGYLKDEMDKMFKSMSGDDQGEFPITARLNEGYSCVTIFCDNETDWVFLKQLLNVRREQSYKNQHIGESRVMTFARFMEALYANRDSLYGTGQVNDDAPAAE